MQIEASESVGAKVTLDGVEVPVWIRADAQAGWVRVSDAEVRRGKVEVTSAARAKARRGR